MKNFIKLVIPFFYGDDKVYARWGGILLLIMSQAMTSFGYLYIQWNRRFYDAIEVKDGSLFLKECIFFAGLGVVFVLCRSFSTYFGQQYALRWRLWMTKTALREWLVHNNRNDIEGSDQRIQEDLMRFAVIFERFFLDAINSVLLIMVFTPLLFTQTTDLVLFGMPMSWLMLLAVLVYTSLGMYISVKIGNPLIKMEYDNQKLEAEFRYHLVHARDGICMPGTFFSGIIDPIANNYYDIYSRQKFFNVWQGIYYQLAFLLPFAFCASSYFGGILTMGMLFQIKSTYSRIRNSMSFLLDNYTQFTEMLSISKRLVEFFNYFGSQQDSDVHGLQVSRVLD